MAYVDTILEPGEELLYRTHRHWIVFWRPTAVMVVALIVWIAMAADGNSDAHAVGVFLLFVGGLWFSGTYLIERFEEFAVTNNRVIKKYGIIRRDVALLPLERIQTVDVSQTVLGRLLNYGTVVIHTAATTHGTTARDYINDPEEWRRQVFRAIEGAQSQQPDGLRQPSPETASRSQSIAERLKELESLFKEGLVSKDEYMRKRMELLERL